jgi:hypothetical protein
MRKLLGYFLVFIPIMLLLTLLTISSGVETLLKFLLSILIAYTVVRLMEIGSELLKDKK